MGLSEFESPQFEGVGVGGQDYPWEKVLKKKRTEGGYIILVQKSAPHMKASTGKGYEYVTWFESPEGHRFWGHYGLDLDAMEDDFNMRG